MRRDSLAAFYDHGRLESIAARTAQSCPPPINRPGGDARYSVSAAIAAALTAALSATGSTTA